jgi:hypothetical protein
MLSQAGLACSLLVGAYIVHQRVQPFLTTRPLSSQLKLSPQEIHAILTQANIVDSASLEGMLVNDTEEGHWLLDKLGSAASALGCSCAASSELGAFHSFQSTVTLQCPHCCTLHSFSVCLLKLQQAPAILHAHPSAGPVPRATVRSCKHRPLYWSDLVPPGYLRGPRVLVLSLCMMSLM